MAAIFDLDGTLLIKGVQPNRRVVDLINRTPDSYIITGRPEMDRSKTVAVLRAHGIQYKALLMNQFRDTPDDQLRSKRLHAKSIMAKQPVEFAIDDNNAARLLYKSLGIKKILTP